MATSSLRTASGTDTTMTRPFEFAARIKSVGHALHGIAYVLRSQHNAWIHAAATIVVAVAGFYFHLTSVEWCCIVIAASSVWTAEALNTALELLADAAFEELHPLIGHAKDVAAGAVLVTAIAAIIVGAIIFWPHIEIIFLAAERTAP
jgi:diacylglycerol kinase (ATP)